MTKRALLRALGWIAEPFRQFGAGGGLMVFAAAVLLLAVSCDSAKAPNALAAGAGVSASSAGVSVPFTGSNASASAAERRGHASCSSEMPS